eukprot:scaffold78922_cov71-Cyclotella_meneghiniana.AAC.1
MEEKNVRECQSQTPGRKILPIYLEDILTLSLRHRMEDRSHITSSSCPANTSVRCRLRSPQSRQLEASMVKSNSFGWQHNFLRL